MTTSPLISVAELAEIIDNEKLLVLDVRASLADANAGRAAYEAGHIPGARFADLEKDVTGIKSGMNGRHPLPDSGRFCVNMRRLGLKPDSIVVVYDDGACNFASRLWFTLRWVGFANVRVLDGGINAWLNAGKKLSTEEEASIEQGTYRATTPCERVFGLEKIVENLASGEYLLVDARARNRYLGEGETQDAAAGHIPGSKSRPFLENMNAYGLFKSPEEIAAEFKAVIGDRDPATVINTCGSGVTACCNHLAMTYAGIKAAGVYIGSWSEWICDENRPRSTEEE